MSEETITNSTKTFGEMISEVQFMVADGEIVFPLDSVKRAINTGLMMVHNTLHREAEDATFMTQASEPNYSIPDIRYDGGEANIDAVWVEGTAIDRAAEYEVEDADTTGQPTEYWILGNELVLRPIPDAEYAINVLYRREFSPLSSDADEAEMSDVEIHAAIMYACYLLKVKDEEFQSAQFFKAAYDEEVGLASRFPAGLYSGDDGRMR